MKKYKVYQLRRENENIIDDYHESYDAKNESYCRI